MNLQSKIAETFGRLLHSSRRGSVQEILNTVGEERSFWAMYRTHPKPETRGQVRKMLRLLEHAEDVLHRQPSEFEGWLASQGQTWHKHEASSRAQSKSTLRICPQCGQGNREYVVTCDYCGTSLVHECFVCGGISFVGVDICPSCGTSHRVELVKRQQEVMVQANEAMQVATKIVEASKGSKLSELLDEMPQKLDSLSMQVQSLEEVTKKSRETKQKALQTIGQAQGEIRKRRNQMIRNWIYTGRPILAYVALRNVDKISYSSDHEPWRKRARRWIILKTTVAVFLGAIVLLLLGISRLPPLQSSALLGDQKLLAAIETLPQARLQLAACLLVTGGTIGLVGSLLIEVNAFLGLGSIVIVNWIVITLLTGGSDFGQILGLFQIIPALYSCVVVILFGVSSEEGDLGKLVMDESMLQLPMTVSIGTMVGAIVMAISLGMIAGTSAVEYDRIEGLMFYTSLLIGAPLGALTGGTILSKPLKGFAVFATGLEISLILWFHALWQ